MTNRELQKLLSMIPDDYDVFVNLPAGSQDYFVDNVTFDKGKEQIFIETAE